MAISKELNHFWVIADLFRQIGGHSSRFVLFSHSQMEHYFFSYLLTFEVYLIEVLEIMAQMLQYMIF